jgi:hypothetical protein
VLSHSNKRILRPMSTPEDHAREHIDHALEQAGWRVQDYKSANLDAGRVVVLRNFPLVSGHGFADYLLYVDDKAAGIIEAKKEGVTLIGVEVQAEKYSKGLPTDLPAYIRPLPFLYQSTGVETRFTNGLDPQPRSRPVFSFHRPETLAALIPQPNEAPEDLHGASLAAETASTLRARLKTLPPLSIAGLWPAQITTITAVGSKVDASFYVEKRDRETRATRWEQLSHDFAYDPDQLDRDVVAPDQVRVRCPRPSYSPKTTHTPRKLLKSFEKSPPVATKARRAPCRTSELK